MTRPFLVRTILQNKKATIDDLEGTLAGLKIDLISAFERQGTIEVEIRALREGEFKTRTPSSSAYDLICYRIREEASAKARGWT